MTDETHHQQTETPPEQAMDAELVPTLLQITVVQAAISVDDIPNGKVISFLSMNGIRIAVPLGKDAAEGLAKKLTGGSGLLVAKGKLPPNMQRQ